MHVVIRHYKIEPDAIEAVNHRIREGFAPYISNVMPGFVSIIGSTRATGP